MCWVSCSGRESRVELVFRTLRVCSNSYGPRVMVSIDSGHDGMRRTPPSSRSSLRLPMHHYLSITLNITSTILKIWFELFACEDAYPKTQNIVQCSYCAPERRTRYETDHGLRIK